MKKLDEIEGNDSAGEDNEEKQKIVGNNIECIMGNLTAE